MNHMLANPTMHTMVLWRAQYLTQCKMSFQPVTDNTTWWCGSQPVGRTPEDTQGSKPINPMAYENTPHSQELSNYPYPEPK